LLLFQLKNNAVEAAETIRRSFDEVTVTHRTCKDCFERFRGGNFNLEGGRRPGQFEKSEGEELRRSRQIQSQPKRERQRDPCASTKAKFTKGARN